jgi:hypothetical protein
LLPSSIASPQRLPIPSPVTAPVRTATGAGLYAGVPRLSRLFFEKIFRPFSADFSPFRLIQKVHPQAISTGGNFMRELLKNSRVKIPFDGAKKIFETKKTSALARCSHTTSVLHAL